MKGLSFRGHTVLLLVLGLAYMFFYAGLQNDHLNVLTPYLQQTYGWDDLNITNPVTVGSLVTIVLYLLVGAAFVRVGIKVILVPSIILMALGCIGIAQAGDNYLFYAVSAFLVRITVVPLQLGGFMLCANWFIRYRGRALGLITAGSPLFSIVGISAMSALVVDMGLDVYWLIAGVLIVMAVLTAWGTRDTPEEAGLHPDGADHAPLSENSDSGEPITARQLLGDPRAWQLIVSYGIMQFVIVAMMAYMAVRYISLGTADDVPNLFVSQALAWLAIGAAAGIPMSYVIGWIDDRFGSITASLVLNVLFFFAVIPLAIMPVGGDAMLMAIWAFGVACMTGGLPTMHPCITSYVYGRRNYMGANKWIMTIQAIPMAFALTYMGAFNQVGNLDMAYYVMIALLVISFFVILSMRGIPDANAQDRQYLG
jgi:OFA family oxalate/formate antiporter-like MFS transporter